MPPTAATVLGAPGKLKSDMCSLTHPWYLWAKKSVRCFSEAACNPRPEVLAYALVLGPEPLRDSFSLLSCRGSSRCCVLPVRPTSAARAFRHSQQPEPDARLTPRTLRRAMEGQRTSQLRVFDSGSGEPPKHLGCMAPAGCQLVPGGLGACVFRVPARVLRAVGRQHSSTRAQVMGLGPPCNGPRVRARTGLPRYCKGRLTVSWGFHR
jgi:hypothetical protein